MSMIDKLIELLKSDDVALWDYNKDAFIEKSKKRQLLSELEGLLNWQNPFCEHCKEEHCTVELDGTCEMIRVYLKAKETYKE
jgi:hypothetical protein